MINSCVSTLLVLCAYTLAVATGSGLIDGATEAAACETQDLHVPLSSDPERRISWAVVCLIRRKDTQNVARNKALAAYLSKFSKQHNFTVLMFSEDQFSSGEVDTWSTQFKEVGQVKLVDTTRNAYWIDGVRKYGYKWMCKFFTVDMYEHIKDFDYYFRVDSDNVLKAPTYDMFEYMESRELEYGYVVRKFEPHLPTRTTLPVFVKQYIKKCDMAHRIAIQEPPLDSNHVFNFYNNLHLGKVSFFNAPRVRHFLLQANHSGLFAHRWGDSTIQAYAVRLFMAPWRVQQLPNVSYHHLSHSSALVTSDPLLATTVPQIFPSGNWTVDAGLTSFDWVKKKVPTSAGHQKLVDQVGRGGKKRMKVMGKKLLE